MKSLLENFDHKAYWSHPNEHSQNGYLDYPVDPLGLATADLTLLEYENIPWDIYPIGEKYRNSD